MSTYHNALSVQPSVAIPEEYQTILKAASVALYVIGQTLVLSAYYRCAFMQLQLLSNIFSYVVWFLRTVLALMEPTLVTTSVS
jgi:hypothetical protein